MCVSTCWQPIKQAIITAPEALHFATGTINRAGQCDSDNVSVGHGAWGVRRGQIRVTKICIKCMGSRAERQRDSQTDERLSKGMKSEQTTPPTTTKKQNERNEMKSFYTHTQTKAWDKWLDPIYHTYAYIYYKRLYICVCV